MRLVADRVGFKLLSIGWLDFELGDKTCERRTGCIPVAGDLFGVIAVQNRIEDRSPGVAALITQFIFQRNLRGLGLGDRAG
jgi:hypothetical protein